MPTTFSLGPHSADKPIRRLPEIEAAVFALRQTEDLPWPARWNHDKDILDWLQCTFGFQGCMDAARNFRFELFSFRTTPHTPLWIDNKGWVFGQISASDKFRLRGSQFSERDFAHVSLFNEDSRNPMQINDSGLVYIGNPSTGHPVSFSCFIEICLELYVTNKNKGYQVCDHKKDLDLSEFWDKKSEGVCGCLFVAVKNGCTHLYYCYLGMP